MSSARAYIHELQRRVRQLERGSERESPSPRLSLSLSLSLSLVAHDRQSEKRHSNERRNVKCIIRARGERNKRGRAGNRRTRRWIDRHSSLSTTMERLIAPAVIRRVYESCHRRCHRRRRRCCPPPPDLAAAYNRHARHEHERER